MKTLAQKISQVPESDYDKKIIAIEDQPTNTAKSLELCKKHKVPALVIASEIVHSQAELEALKNKEISFRNEGENDEEIAGLSELIEELETILKGKFANASRLEQFEQRQTMFDASVAIIEPLCTQITELQKQLQAESKNIQHIRTSTLNSPLNPTAFKFAEELSKPGV